MLSQGIPAGTVTRCAAGCGLFQNRFRIRRVAHTELFGDLVAASTGRTRARRLAPLSSYNRAAVAALALGVERRDSKGRLGRRHQSGNQDEAL